MNVSSGSDRAVGLFASANIAISAGASWTDKIDAAMHTAVTLGQVAVAVVTVIYIIRKTKLLKTPTPKDDNEGPDPTD